MAGKIVLGDVAKLDNYLICVQTPFENHSGGESMTVAIPHKWRCDEVGDSVNISYAPPRFRAYRVPTLHLTIGNSAKYGGAWFDRILSGEKREEYREMSAFYESRFYCALENPAHATEVAGTIRKDLKILHLTNGRGDRHQQLWVCIDSISIGRGNPEWGAPMDRDVFIIKLGGIIHTKNLKPLR